MKTYYEVSDLFVFPSTTDTFGMVILEAQAKGLFALVTDIGGPQEIIENGKTGHILNLSDKNEWVQRILDNHMMKKDDPDGFIAMRKACQRRIMQQYDWDEALKDILEASGGPALKMIRKEDDHCSGQGFEPSKIVA